MTGREKKPYPHQVSVEVSGKVYTGTAYMEPGGVVAVTSAYGEKADYKGDLPFELFAEQLLKESVIEAIAQGK